MARGLRKRHKRWREEGRSGGNNVERKETYWEGKQEKPLEEGTPFNLGLEGWVGIQKKTRGKSILEKENIIKMKIGRCKLH